MFNFRWEYHLRFAVLLKKLPNENEDDDRANNS